MAIVAYIVLQNGWKTRISMRSPWGQIPMIRPDRFQRRAYKIFFFFLPRLPVGSTCFVGFICPEIILFWSHEAIEVKLRVIDGENQQKKDKTVTFMNETSDMWSQSQNAKLLTRLEALRSWMLKKPTIFVWVFIHSFNKVINIIYVLDIWITTYSLQN